MLGVLLGVLLPGHGGIGGTLGEAVGVAVSGNWLTKTIHFLGEEVKITKSGNQFTKNIYFLGEEVKTTKSGYWLKLILTMQWYVKPGI
jgi:hypothetical protein